MDTATDHNIEVVSNNSTNCYKTQQVALFIIQHHKRDDFKKETNIDKKIQ
jgi:hypothetical protein